MSTGNEGSHTHAQRAMNTPSSYLPNAGLNMNGGGTYTNARTEPSLQDFEDVFGPAARNIKEDLQRYKRHGRWHLPDTLKGPNMWLTDRIDGLITDATNSPFTGTILPYKYIDNADGKIQWNVWSFDEGMASRVPYESAARTLTQTKRSFKAYAVRHGLAIVMEHNFMVSPKGKQNFQDQLQQMVGSIQYTNDLDVHVALVSAKSFEKDQMEKYNNYGMSASQAIREYVDLFGFMQKNTNALDILIEESKRKLKLWGGPMPNFLLTNSKLTFQLTMTPERTNYISQGPDGVKRLRQGPDISSYRGISIIPSRAFSMDIGQVPRDILRRRVRVAEYYRIKPDKNNNQKTFELYDEGKDTFFVIEYKDLFKYAQVADDNEASDVQKRHSQRIKTNLKKLGVSTDAAVVVVPPPSHAPGRNFGSGPSGLRTNNPVTQFKRSLLNVSNMITGRTVSVAEANNMKSMDDVKNLAELKLTQQLVDDEYKNPFFSVGLQIAFDKVQLLVDEMSPEFRIKYEKNKGFFAKHNINSQAKIYKSPQYEGWHEVMEHVAEDTHSGDLDISIPSDMVLASFLTDDLVFVPFVQKLAMDERAVTKKERHALVSSPSVLSRERKLMEDHPEISLKGIHEGIVSYPRLSSGVSTPPALHSPYTGDAVTKGHAMYYEIRVAMARMLSRYACSAHALRTVTDANGKTLAMNKKDICDNTGDAIGTMYYQPLGAFNDPNNEMHLEGVPKSSARALHENWILTEEVLNLIQEKPEYIQAAAKIAASVFQSYTRRNNTEGVTRAQLSDAINSEILSTFANESISPVDNYCMYKGVYTWSVANNFLSSQDYLNPHTALYSKFHTKLRDYAPRAVVTNEYLAKLAEVGLTMSDDERSMHAWLTPVDFSMVAISYPDVTKVSAMLQHRVSEDAFSGCKAHLSDSLGAVKMIQDIMGVDPAEHRMISKRLLKSSGIIAEGTPTFAVPHQVEFVDRWVINDEGMGMEDGKPGDDDDPDADDEEAVTNPANWEFVIIRPNIEHYMLGIIMGLAGDQLGNTLWGQTELSCYDDAQHGVWGMSYKYHERAIVFNEKNLIRLWDIAYDGYNGGKDDTYVRWDDEKSVDDFKAATNDMTQDYHGPSMMVMAFYMGDKVLANHRTNWPSPIVYHQKGDTAHATPTALTGAENIMKIGTKEFEVFDKTVYREYHQVYFPLMPDFSDLHQVRKCACQSAVDDESQSDVLAFQGTIKTNGATIMGCNVINGSGHHGVDFVGAASVRSGKGYKITGGISNIVRQI